jgi:signal transduction histidine kinase
LEERLRREGKTKDAEDIDHMKRDYLEYLHESVLRVSSTRYMNSVPEPNYDYFLPYKGFLFKWNAIYRTRAKNSQKRFHMVIPSENEYEQGLRPYMEADRDMMEQAGYNLTNNAFKYARPGTTIVVDCKLSDDSKDWYELTVTNYGVSIPEEDFVRLGNYGFRGSNSDRAEGGGLGLWHCNEIAEKHGGKLLKARVHISDYDITSLLTFDEMREDEKRLVINRLEKDGEKRQALRENIDAELRSLKKLEDWEQIDAGMLRQVANPFAPPHVAKMMRRGTTKYIFTIRIPTRRADT